MYDCKKSYSHRLSPLCIFAEWGRPWRVITFSQHRIIYWWSVYRESYRDTSYHLYIIHQSYIMWKETKKWPKCAAEWRLLQDRNNHGYHIMDTQYSCLLTLIIYCSEDCGAISSTYVKPHFYSIETRTQTKLYLQLLFSVSLLCRCFKCSLRIVTYERVLTFWAHQDMW